MTERKKKLFRDILDVCKRGCLTARFGTIHFEDDDDDNINVYTGRWFVGMYSPLTGNFYVGGESSPRYSDEICEKFFENVSYYRTRRYPDIDWTKRNNRFMAKSLIYSPNFF